MRKVKWFLFIGACGVAAVAMAAQSGRVMMNGKVVSADTRVINGTTYVKLADVAKALEMTIVKKGSDLELVKAGGANQLQGTNGKLGEELFTGQWKFTATKMSRVQSYKGKHNPNITWETEAEPGHELVVVDCRFKNGVNKTVYMYFNGLGNTSLTDMSENVYAVKLYDSKGGVAENILPGAAKEFTIVFSVPKGTEVKDLIYTIEPVSGEYKKVDLRISLK
jgi:hypothetical protein